MRPLFSEFSFGFSISHEIQTAVGRSTRSAPVLPSLLDERKLGWDVKFRLQGLSIFLQFKRSDYLQTKRAREWAHFRTPYYRFPVYRVSESPQHNLLVGLSAKEPHVYYCAPMFHTDAEFNRYFMNHAVLGHSVLISLRALPRILDKGSHHIVYAPSHGLFLSDATPLDMVIADKRISDLMYNFDRWRSKDPKDITLTYLQSLWDSLITIIVANDSPPPELEPNSRNPADLVRALRLVLRTYYGLEWILIS